MQQGRGKRLAIKIIVVLISTITIEAIKCASRWYMSSFPIEHPPQCRAYWFRNDVPHKEASNEKVVRIRSETFGFSWRYCSRWYQVREKRCGGS